MFTCSLCHTTIPTLTCHIVPYNDYLTPVSSLLVCLLAHQAATNSIHLQHETFYYQTHTRLPEAISFCQRSMTCNEPMPNQIRPFLAFRIDTHRYSLRLLNFKKSEENSLFLILSVSHNLLPKKQALQYSMVHQIQRTCVQKLEKEFGLIFETFFPL